MNAFTKLANTLALPLGIILMVGIVGALVWLAILGEWGLIGYGIAALIFSSLCLGIAMMPGLLLAAPAAALEEAGNKFWSYVLGFLSILYTSAVLTVWCMALLYFFATQANTESIIPALIWSFGVATIPLVQLAENDFQSGNESTYITTLVAQMAYVLAIISVLFFRMSFLEVTVLFGVVMFVGYLIQFIIASRTEKEVYP